MNVGVCASVSVVNGFPERDHFFKDDGRNSFFLKKKKKEKRAKNSCFRGTRMFIPFMHDANVCVLTCIHRNEIGLGAVNRPLGNEIRRDITTCLV